jgi:hypothetical protein
METSLRAILARYAGVPCRSEPPVPVVSVQQRGRLYGTASMEQNDGRTSTTQVFRNSCGLTLETQAISPILWVEDGREVRRGYLSIEFGWQAFDLSGGKALLQASLEEVNFALQKAAQRSVPLTAAEFPDLTIQGWMGMVTNDLRVIPFREMKPGENYIMNSLAMFFVVERSGQTEKFAVCVPNNVTSEELIAGTKQALQPIWSENSFKRGTFDINRARLTGVIRRIRGDLADC